MGVISGVYHNNAICLSDHWNFFEIRHSETKFQSDFRKFVFNSISLSDSWKFLRITPLRLNLFNSSNHSLYYNYM